MKSAEPVGVLEPLHRFGVTDVYKHRCFCCLYSLSIVLVFSSRALWDSLKEIRCKL